MQALAGQVFVFQVLFTDGAGNPILVDDPTIQIHRFNAAGMKIPLLFETPLSAIAGEEGRYAYPYMVPDTLEDRTMIYGLMQGNIPMGGVALVEQAVTVVVPTTHEPPQPSGLVARFVKGG